MAKAATKAASNAFEDVSGETLDENRVAGASFETDNDGNIMIALDDVQEQSFEAIPKGIYPVVIEQVEYQLSKSSGQPMWNVRLGVTDGEYTNRKLFTFISFSPKALPGTKGTIRVIAPHLLQGQFNPKQIAEDGELIGIQCRVKVSIETYEGQDRNRVQRFMAGSDSQNAGFVA